MSLGTEVDVSLETLQHLLHEPLKHRWCVCETKSHHLEFKKPLWRDECCLLN